MATGPDLAQPPHFPTAAEIDPAPPDPGPCPECGQPRANRLNEFATGSRAHPALRVSAREVTDAPDPDGPEGGEAA
jgi:hypothetical protein